MDSELEDIIDILNLLFLVNKCYVCWRKIKTARRFWVNRLYLNRSVHGLYESSFGRLKEDPVQFRKAVRMDLYSFNVLHNLLKEKLSKHSIRTPISSECRLFVTLLYLAHGGSRQLHTLTHKMGLTTFRRITLETCSEIWDTLAEFYIPVPNKEEWKRIAKDFNNMWNMPNCIGAIDGKHITISCPPHSGTFFYNYKGQYSIVLMGVCDANYKFIAVDIGAYGSQSDGGIFHFSNFSKAINEGQLEIPEKCQLPHSEVEFPHYFVGDAAFPLKPYLMRPYPGRLLDEKKEYFNRRLSRARRIIENTFGILTAKWRILRTTLCMAPKNAEKIIKAAVALHNFLKLNDTLYIQPDYVDRDNGDTILEGSWRLESIPLPSVSRVSSNRACMDSYNLRDELKEYLYRNKI